MQKERIRVGQKISFSDAGECFRRAGEELGLDKDKVKEYSGLVFKCIKEVLDEFYSDPTNYDEYKKHPVGFRFHRFGTFFISKKNMLRLNFLHKPAESNVKQIIKEIKSKIEKDKNNLKQ